MKCCCHSVVVLQSSLAAVKKFVRYAGTTKQKNVVGTSLRRLTIKTLSLLQRSVGSAIVAYRRVCQKGAGSEGACAALASQHTR